MSDSASDIPQQQPGCLPVWANEDSWLTPAEFCLWQRRGRNWFARKKRRLPGVVCRGRNDCRIHVGMFLNGTFQRARGL